jgi:hypothetical protein
VILNKIIAVGFWATPVAFLTSAAWSKPLGLVGIKMEGPEFMAGIFLSLPAYYFGRQIWKEQGKISFWTGMGMALFASVVIAAAPGLIPLDVPTQIKMALVSLCITLIVARAERQGKKWSEDDDTDS